MTQPEPPLKRTPLHAAHVRLGARMIPFGGWDMPVQYIGVGYVPAALAPVGSTIAVEVRGRGQTARVVKTPFHPSRVKR